MLMIEIYIQVNFFNSSGCWSGYTAQMSSNMSVHLPRTCTRKSTQLPRFVCKSLNSKFVKPWRSVSYCLFLSKLNCLFFTERHTWMVWESNPSLQKKFQGKIKKTPAFKKIVTIKVAWSILAHLSCKLK